MSAEATKKSTVATAETIDDVYHEAMRSYEKALKSGIQLQEESVNLWKDLLTKLTTPDPPARNIGSRRNEPRRFALAEGGKKGVFFG